jgi:CBS domain containing-hemolysin-like protein
MADPVLSAARIGLALFLVFLNGFFVAAEFALVRLRSASVDRMMEEGHRFAPLVEEATENLDDYLAVCQLGITIASLGLGWVGEPAVAVLVEPLLEPVLPRSLLHAVTVGIGFAIVTFLHVVYGELAPKTMAIQRAEQISLLVAPPMKLFYYLFLPGIVLFNGIAIRSVRLFGFSSASDGHGTHSEREILAILADAGDAGHVDAEEVAMIERVFSLDDTVVREIMRPRPDVSTIPGDTPMPELRSMAIEGEYTRYPVVEDGDVVGFVDVKDVLRASENIDAATDVTATDLSRDVLVVPETLTVDELLTEFQTQNRQMAAVIDEWGAFEGLVTIEDVVEVVVGDIRDQFDLSESAPSIDQLDDGGYAIAGDVSLARVNETLGTNFEQKDVETVGGFVLSRLGRAPKVDDAIAVDGYEFRVEDVDGARITALVVTEGED